MRQVTRKGLITVAAASGVLAVTGGYAHADSGANGKTSDSPGVASGNTIQLPVDVPINLCGNTVNVIGLLNPAAGNSCANDSDNGTGGKHKPSGGGATAEGSAKDSPGVASGNHVQLPVDVPVNACGNSVSIVGLGNATSGNACSNESGPVKPPGNDHPGEPQEPQEPDEPNEPNEPGNPNNPDTPDNPSSPDEPTNPNEPGTQIVTPPKGSEQLAHTGSDLPIGIAVPASAGLLLAGAVLYRRSRQAA
ncbi:chaplin [Streptomyces sp. NBC_01304]|uniref:chaplin n=1 Tax=Streptomyces sp. NBC_01304 TaxID=2903818 RepID=UPI002E1089D2|nr:chaplin [Streptomyces sp. NBC_01304]